MSKKGIGNRLFINWKVKPGSQFSTFSIFKSEFLKLHGPPYVDIEPVSLLD
jgi:hypothetical protein